MELMEAVKAMGAGMVERHGSRPGRRVSFPAFTIRASAGGMEPGGFRFMTPDGQYRRMAAVEAALFQGYPVDWLFAGTKTMQFLQVGNAVPPPVAKAALEELWKETHMENHAVLDLFAGSGVGCAIQQLGAKDYGVEMMPEAQETRRLNGMETVYSDVWDIERADSLTFDTLWASPPCQTFSVAGKGAGRKALDDVLKTLESGAWRDMTELRAWSDSLGDDRIGLVLSPLAYVHRFRPTFVALEQVPTVLPVWQAMAGVLEEMGYSTWTGYLNAEQFGVPQTRKRAYLIARCDGIQAAPPVATHSKYHTHDPAKLDAGVLPWISMAEALGWGMTERAYPTVAPGVGQGGVDPMMLGGSGARRTLREARESEAWIPPKAVAG